MSRTNTIWIALPMLASWKIPATYKKEKQKNVRAASNSLPSCSFLYKESLSSNRITCHVHDGEDVGLNISPSVVVHEFGVAHHHGLHPALFADGARGDPPRSFPLLTPFPIWIVIMIPTLLFLLPALSLLLHLLGILGTICTNTLKFCSCTTAYND